VKKIVIIIAIVVAILGIYVFAGFKAYGEMVIDLAIKKVMEDGFSDMAKSEGVIANTMVDPINSRYHELQEAFIEGQKKWPRYANPKDILRYAETGKMYKEFLRKDMDPRKAKCVACHNYQDLNVYLLKQYTDSGGAL
jgi:hypothetical protein